MTTSPPPADRPLVRHRAATPPANRAAIAALVMSVVAVLASWVPMISLIAAIVAIVVSIIAIRRAVKTTTPGYIDRKYLSIACLCVSLFALLVGGFVTFITIYVLTSCQMDPQCAQEVINNLQSTR